MSRLSRQRVILNILQPYRPPRPVTGIALLLGGNSLSHSWLHFRQSMVYFSTREVAVTFLTSFRAKYGVFQYEGSRCHIPDFISGKLWFISVRGKSLSHSWLHFVYSMAYGTLKQDMTAVLRTISVHCHYPSETKRTKVTRYGDVCCMRILWTALYWLEAHGKFAVRPIPCLVAECRKVQIREHYLLPYALCNTVRAPYMGKPWTCKAHIGITKAIVIMELLVYIICNYVKRCSSKLTRISLISYEAAGFSGVAQLVKTFPKGSLPRSQQPSRAPYAETGESP
jgi:hypothetical protein